MKILGEILSYKRKFLEERKRSYPLEGLKRQLDKELKSPQFASKLSSKGIHLVAEIKKASPSAGILCDDFEAARIARDYEKGGAAALSVLTEDRYFKGDLSHLLAVREAVSLPLLRKDFIIDEYQIYESKFFGADAILLITGILEPPVLAGFLKKSQELKLDAVVEVHTEDELKRGLDTGARMIGINTRNLRDFSLNLKALPRLLEKVPQDKLVICESGVKTADDLAFVKSFKVNAVLVGEALMRAQDKAAKTKEFVDYLK